MNRKEFCLGGIGGPEKSVVAKKGGEPEKAALPVVAIRADDLAPQEIEDAILQVLALGRVACVDEEALALALEADVADPTVTHWAEAFAAAFDIHWERRRLFQDLLFSLRDR